MTQGYSLRDVGRLLGLSRSIVSGLIDAGFVSPTRGRRNELRFTFQDLVLLRAAQGLRAANVPPSRIVRALRRLRAELPESVPLTGLRIEAAGDTVVVSEGKAQWQAEDGQYVLRFSVEARDDNDTSSVPLASKARADATPGTALPGLAFVDAGVPWFEQGLALEAKDDVAGACRAYRNALREDARHLCAYVNLGRCLHAHGQLAEAEATYREGLVQCGSDETLLFNLAIVLEDLKREDDAANTYRAALQHAPDMADAHYNLALLCDAKGLRQEALRHWSAYRRLNP